MTKNIPEDFDSVAYLIINPDVAAARLNPVEHYVNFGRIEGRAYKLTNKHKVNSTSIMTDTDAVDALESDRDLIKRSGLFDECWYRLKANVKDDKIDPILHYLTEGERLGLNPSRQFDAQGYKYINNDIANSNYNALVHYLRFGSLEGRSRSIIDSVNIKEISQTEKRFIVIMFHECSRTGAPILGWNLVEQLKRKYRIIALVKSGGPLLKSISTSAEVTIILPEGFIAFPAQSYLLAKKIYETYVPLYGIANSVETRYFVPSFKEVGLPILSLVHEFASYDWIPNGSLKDLFETSTHIVFSAHLVEQDCFNFYPCISHASYEVMAQGRSILPPENVNSAEHLESFYQLPIDLSSNEGAFLVAGLGRVNPRKGVDLFIDTALHFFNQQYNRNVIFVWIGGWDDADAQYAEAQKKKIKESALDKKIILVPEQKSLHHIYENIDLLFLSSRLDPMPNVAIDALCQGIPIICFRDASGIAEILAKTEKLADLVIDKFDLKAAAEVILNVSNPERVENLRSDLDKFSAIFDMENYVRKLDRRMLDYLWPTVCNYEE